MPDQREALQLLVERFSDALLLHLTTAARGDLAAQDGWESALLPALMIAAGDGDRLAVAAYCSLAWHQGWRFEPPSMERAAALVEDLAVQLRAQKNGSSIGIIDGQIEARAEVYDFAAAAIRNQCRAAAPIVPAMTAARSDDGVPLSARTGPRRIYIAARFSRRPDANELARRLQGMGHSITSRWVRPGDDHVLPTGLSDQAADAERRRFAMEDCDDVRAADWTISLMEEPRSNGRGGRHIEFGMALALGHRLTIIGPRETVFHHLDLVEHFASVGEFLAAMAVEEGAR